MFLRNDGNIFYSIVILFFVMIIFVDALQIRVQNKGAYVARVLLRYQKSNGEEQSFNSGNFLSLQSALLNLEDNTKSIEIEVQMYSFINTVRTIFKTSNTCPYTRCFVIWGTVFKSEWNENCCQ